MVGKMLEDIERNAARFLGLALMIFALMFLGGAGRTSAATVPVLLVHGCCAGSPADMNDLAAALTSQGRTVYNLNIPSATDPAANAWYIWGFVVANGLGQVDVVGYSMGGLSGRYFIKNLGGDVRNLVMLDTPNAGDWLLCGPFFWQSYNLCPNSAFLTGINAGDQTPGPTLYVSIAANYNVVLSGGECYLQTSGDHWSIPHRADVIGWTETALAGSCPGTYR